MVKTAIPAMPSPYKLFAVFMLLLVIIVFAGIGYFLIQRNYIIRHEQDKLGAIADLRVGQIVRWRNERLNHIEYIYNNPLFARQVKAFFENPDNAEKRQDIEAWMKSLQVRDLFAEVYILNAKGKVILTSKNAGELGVHAKELIAQVLVNRTPVFSDLHSAPNVNVNLSHFDIVIPLIVPETPESVTGILFMRMNPRSGLYERIQPWPTPSLTAETLLIRRDGDSVLFLTDLRHLKDAALKLRIPLTENNCAAVKVVNGAQGIIEGVDYRGVPVLAVARKIPDTSWIMIAKIDKNEIYAPLREEAWIAGIGMFFLITGAAAAVRLWWWRQRTRFYLELDKERKLSEEKIRQLAAMVENSNDAIFALTLDGIISSWNRGAESIFGYREFEVFGKSIALLIPPADRKDVTAFLEKLNQRKSIEHHEAAYRRKDGKNVTLSLSISPVMYDGGKIIGASFIGRDITDRVRMENELRQSREQLEVQVSERTAQLHEANHALSLAAQEWQATFDNISDAISLLAEDGRILKCNAAMGRMFGRTSAEIIGRHCFEIVHGTSAPVADCPFVRASQSRRRETIELVLDGRYFAVSVDPLFDQQGKFTGAVHIISDITERKRIEEELQKSEIKFKTVIENAGSAIFLVDAETGMITDCNSTAEILTGRARQEIIGMPQYEFHPGDPEKVKAFFGNMVKKGSYAGIETEILHKNGKIIPVLISGQIVTIDHRRLAVKFLSDITERKRIEEELQKSEIKFKTVFEHTGSAIFIVDAATGMVIDCNSIAERLTGRTRQEILSMPQFVLHPDPEKIKALFYDVSSPSYLEFETELQHKSGRHIPVLVGGQFVTINNRKVAIGFCFDITERKKITEKLQELNDAKDRFFSIIGHDLKNMFNNILGFSDLLKEDVQKGDIKRIEEEVGVINSSSRKAYNMLLNLLEWANSQKGNVQFAPSPLALDELVKETLDELDETVLKKNIKFKIDIPDNFKVTADKNMLITALRNLITNAIKFSHRDGQIELRAVADGGQVEISVSDNGVGMDEEIIQKLFKTSTNISMPGTENEHGTGPGLLLCAEFVKKHGGKIWAESEPGKGSSFKFTLPAIYDESAAKK
ncbi:MAG: PAS domain S-box protein [Victivallaceae bacterium]|jgi:PAS domain S-box-containing protein